VLGRLRRRRRQVQQVETELQRILLRRVRKLVDERLHHERHGIAAGRRMAPVGIPNGIIDV
jgi:hypothetical protein